MWFGCEIITMRIDEGFQKLGIIFEDDEGLAQDHQLLGALSDLVGTKHDDTSGTTTWDDPSPIKQEHDASKPT